MSCTSLIEDVIRDAVFYELRRHVRGALGENLTDFDLASGRVFNDSNSTLDRDKVVSSQLETCYNFDWQEPEPMDTTEA